MKEKIECRLARTSELDEVKIIMNNEEISERETLGYNFERTFRAYKILFRYRTFLNIFFPREVIFYIIVKDGNIIGGTRCVIVDRQIANIGFVSITKDYRNMGYGSLLMDRCSKYLRQNGIRTVRLSVSGKNQGAINFYKKLGFQYIDTFYIVPSHHLPFLNKIKKRPYYHLLLADRSTLLSVDEFNILKKQEPMVQFDCQLIMAKNLN